MTWAFAFSFLSFSKTYNFLRWNYQNLNKDIYVTSLHKFVKRHYRIWFFKFISYLCKLYRTCLFRATATIQLASSSTNSLHSHFLSWTSSQFQSEHIKLSLLPHCFYMTYLKPCLPFDVCFPVCKELFIVIFLKKNNDLKVPANGSISELAFIPDLLGRRWKASFPMFAKTAHLFPTLGFLYWK